MDVSLEKGWIITRTDQAAYDSHHRHHDSQLKI